MANKIGKEIDGNAAPVGNVQDSQATNSENEVYEDEEEYAANQIDPISHPITLRLSRSLIRKLTDNAREEGVTIEELASELVAEGVVLRAWEIVEKKATMRGGNTNQGNQGNFNRGGNNTAGNQSIGNHGNTPNHGGHQRPFQQGGNKMAQKKLQRQARQHANAMDLMADKAAFLEYVRNQEKKRR